MTSLRESLLFFQEEYTRAWTTKRESWWCARRGACSFGDQFLSGVDRPFGFLLLAIFFLKP